MSDHSATTADDRRMTDAEGLMWRLEKDPHLSSTFANVTLLDRPPRMDEFLATMERAVQAVPRLRQRVQPMPANLSAPMWVDDSQFDLHYHVRHVALPAPGSLRQLLDLTALVTADPFERTRPLWQFFVVEGLEGGRAALIQKMHHTITDGERGVEMSLQFLDFQRDPAPRPALDPDQLAAQAEAPPEPVPADLMRDLLAGGLRLPLGLLRQVKDLLSDPTGIPDASNAAADTVRGVVSQLSDVEQARSPLWTERSLRRRIETIRAPFGPTRDAARALGGTLNTAFLAAAADAAGRYHRALGAPVDELRASMAVSTRTEASGNNAFTLARMLVPTGEMSMRDRFAAIQSASGHARQQTATASLETLAAVAAALPTSLITRLARQQAHTVDFATSNVRGAPVPMYLAGAQLLENYPVGPLGGVAYNLTLLSYNHSLDMGVNIDTAAVSEPELLRASLEAAFATLVDEGSRPAASTKPVKKATKKKSPAKKAPAKKVPAKQQAAARP
jgi:WS/DGAT/MGAT family acyltransferase